MRGPANSVTFVVSFPFLIYLCACGSSSNVGPPPSTCTVNGDPTQGVPCKIALDGGVDTNPAGLSCSIGFANYDSQTNRTSILGIGGNSYDVPHNPNNKVRSISIDLQFVGRPPSGLSPQNAVIQPLIPVDPGPGPDNITIILPDTGFTTYFTSYTGAGPGQMSLTLTGAEKATGTQTGSSDLYCIHGWVTADVPKLSPGPPSIIHLDAGF